MASSGNDLVIKVLEQTLAEAREGRMGYVGIICGDPPVNDGMSAFKGTFHGDAALDEGALIAVRNLLKNMEEAWDATNIPVDSTMPRDCVMYDVPRGAMSYDFCNWIVERRMEMDAAGLPGPLKVAFWYGKDGKWGYEHKWRRTMLENVIKPMLPMMGAVEDESALGGNVCKYYLPLGISEKCREGQEVPRFKAPAHKREEVRRWLGKRKRPMVITLRETHATSYRNSNLSAWVRFAWHLEEQGHNVIFVRDTAKAFDPKPDRFHDCPLAAVDVQFRMALYEESACCFYTSNGPHLLTVYSDVPYLVFIPVRPDGHEYNCDTPWFWRNKFGIEPGDQWPWARENQRIIWGPDSFENIMAAWAEFSPLKEAAAA